MTAVGKILVFMNLLFSVAVSAMIVIVFTTRSNWKAEYEKMRNVALVAEAAYKTEKIAHENDLKTRESQNDSSDKVAKALAADVDRLTKKLDETIGELGKERTENSKLTTNTTSLSAQVVTLQGERDFLTKEVQDARAAQLAQQKELNDQKLLAVTNRIEADSFIARARRLLERVEVLEKDNAQLTNRLAAAGISADRRNDSSIINPPPVPAPRDVYGTVMAVGTTGLIVINIGSDSGLSAGNKLVIYRIDEQNPKGLYLGEMIVGRTEPKQAVGQFYPKPLAKPDERLPKEKDIVSTSLGTR